MPAHRAGDRLERVEFFDRAIARERHGNPTIDHLAKRIGPLRPHRSKPLARPRIAGHKLRLKRRDVETSLEATIQAVRNTLEYIREQEAREREDKFVLRKVIG